MDASGDGLGAVLAQIQDTVHAPEQNYPAYKLEFMALNWAITEKFHGSLHSRHFKAYTDNNPLVYVMTSAKLDYHSQRWVRQLSSYDFSITYHPGQSNANADGLSRMPRTKHIAASTADALMNDAIDRVTSPTFVMLSQLIL